MSADLDELRAWLTRVEADLTDTQQTLSDAIADAGQAAFTAATPEDRFEPMYGDVEGWVREVFAPVFARSIGWPVKWCAQWLAHGEAVLRLEALWRSWEIHRLDRGRGMATWLRDFADAQLAALLADGGTFCTCTPDNHLPMDTLPLTPAPADHWQRQD